MHAAPPRRHFLRLTAMAAASVLAPRILWAEQGEAPGVAAGVGTFEEVWRTVRDRFYDPHLHGLDWPAVRERHLPDAERATSDEALARVINSMLSGLQASHTHYYTADEPEYYQLAGIFAGALRRRGLDRAFPGGRVGYPGIGILSRADRHGRSTITGVIDGTPARQAGLIAGDEIISADGAPFQPVRSFRSKVGQPVMLGLSRAGAIWDLRDGWGGAMPQYLDLFNTRAPTMQFTDRNGARGFEGVKWRKPVAMLVNGGTRSGKEVLAYGFKKYRLGEVIGTRTEGAVLAATAFLIGGGLLLLAVSDVLVDGERLEGVGVAPTIDVQAGPPSVDGDDPQLDRAVAVLSGT